MCRVKNKETKQKKRSKARKGGEMEIRRQREETGEMRGGSEGEEERKRREQEEKSEILGREGEKESIQAPEWIKY